MGRIKGKWVKGPHWDYESPDFPDGVRIKPDGTWEHKKEGK